MKERTLTALGIIAVALFAMSFGNKGLLVLVFALILIAGYEIYDIRKDQYRPWMLAVIIPGILIGGLIDASLFMVFLGILIFVLFTISVSFEWFSFNEVSYSFIMIAMLVFALQSLKITLSYGMLLFLYVLIANFATDTFAYFGGYFFGKRKLNKRISPKKTIEGSVIGYVMSAILSLTFAYFVLPSLNLPSLVYITASLSIPFVSQVGDLAFSLIKRHFDIKDFGKIFPGHGGVLDRIDSVIFSLMCFNIILLVFA